jgi:hypothetical protein
MQFYYKDKSPARRKYSWELEDEDDEDDEDDGEEKYWEIDAISNNTYHEK